jgi:hypothetical protein
MRYFLRFAVDVGLLSPQEGESRFRTTWTALVDAAKIQDAHHAASEPTQRYLELLAQAVASGQAHLTDMRGNRPPYAIALGWKKVRVGTEGVTDLRQQGECIGFVDGNDVYLLPDAAYRAAQRAAGQGDGVPVAVKTLSKRLHEKGLLITTDATRKRQTVRVTVAGARHNVLHLRRDDVLPVESTQSAQSDHHAAEPDESEGD